MLLVGNGFVVTRDESQRCIADGCVALDGNLIVEVGPTRDMVGKYPRSEFINAQGKVIMPGLINTHMHLYSTFARGMGLKDESPGNFREILERLWWRLDKVLTLDDIYYSALVPLIDCIKNGTTTIFDHHASPGAVRGSLVKISEAVRLTGVRTCLSYEVSDRDGVEVLKQGIEENVEFIKSCNDVSEDLIRGMFGLHASMTLSDKTLDLCKEACAGLGVGFHIHAAEGREDLEDSLARCGKRVITRLKDFGILGSKTIAAHCIHIDDAEIKLLKESRTKVVHNPESNMGNAVGCAPVPEMFRQGVTVGLGTDGYTTDMLESLKVANILHKHHFGDPGAGAAEAPIMLFGNNRQICSEYFHRPLGVLVAGAYADLIVVDYDPPTPLHGGNVDGHVVFGMSGRMVETTIINGRVLMRDRKLQHIDEAEVMVKSRELADKVWQRF